jgi:uncharacterized protein (DUF1800 family)
MKVTPADSATRHQQHCIAKPANDFARRRRGARCLFAIAIGSLTMLSMAISAAATLVDQADATRLLEQSTFGPTDALVAHVQAVGVQGWLNEQFAAQESQYPAFPYAPPDANTFCATSTNPNCLRDNYSLFLLQNAFFRNALTGTDQLRQRVAFAFSQIFVTSGIVVNVPYGMAKYQQLLLDNAFGNFQDLLTKVTLSSVMGDYLNMVNNDKTTGTVNPNENYAREVMQLFSIGVWQLNEDGTRVLDANGAPIPTYAQATVDGYANLFTGWTYPLLPGTTQKSHNPKNFLGDMVAVPANHDFDAKTLIEGVVDTAGKPMASDLAFAMQGLSLHPNVGPFIGRQLIQKLVTGNPSPQYVARVSAVFDNDGSGVRGSLKAVVTAILTDPEARGDVKADPTYGKLREPMLFLTEAARAVGTTSDGVYFTQQAKSLGQDLFNSPSVFNYYPPTYVVPGTTVFGPEFALQNASTAINRYNFANAFSFGTIPPLSTLPGATGTQPNWSALQSVAANPATLVSELNSLLMHGTMPPAMQATILSAVALVPASDPLTRAKNAYYLTITSPQFQVER